MVDILGFSGLFCDYHRRLMLSLLDERRVNLQLFPVVLIPRGNSEHAFDEKNCAPYNEFNYSKRCAITQSNLFQRRNSG